MKKGTIRSGKKKTKPAPRVGDDDILPEYDFSRAGPNPVRPALRRRHERRRARSRRCRRFPDARAVNRALRALAGIIQDTTRKSSAVRTKPKTARTPS